MEKLNMNRLKSQALQSANFRNHKMGKWESGTNKNVAYSRCEVCGMEVGVNIKPLPNEIDIGGEAVALDCTSL